MMHSVVTDLKIL